MAKNKKQSDFYDEVKALRPNTCLIFRTSTPFELIQTLARFAPAFNDQNINVIILDHLTMLQELSIPELAAMGLQYIPRKDLQ